jgi:hypothetical protein
MKHIIYFLIIVVLNSCGPEAEMFQRQYIIENGTGIPVELQFYRNGELAFRFSETQLQNTEQLEGLIIDRSGGPWSELSPEQLSDAPIGSFEADSVRIIYENLKISTFTYKNSPNGGIFTPTVRNVLRDSDYSDIGGDKFLFTINQSDFENATDCNGNCN